MRWSVLITMKHADHRRDTWGGRAELRILGKFLMEIVNFDMILTVLSTFFQPELVERRDEKFRRRVGQIRDEPLGTNGLIFSTTQSAFKIKKWIIENRIIINNIWLSCFLSRIIFYVNYYIIVLKCMKLVSSFVIIIIMCLQFGIVLQGMHIN